MMRLWIVLGVVAAIPSLGCQTMIPRSEASMSAGNRDLIAAGSGLVIQEVANDLDENASYDDATPAPARARDDEAGDPTPPGKRLLIYHGDFQILVPSVDESIDRWLARVEAAGGYLQSRSQGRLVCRIPAAQFRPLVAEVPNFGRILRQSLSTQDVTREYYDVEIRLDTARKALQRLQALLEKATQVEEILQIEKEIHRLTEQIERFEGELRFMNDQISFSTLTVNFQSNAPAVRTGRRKQSRFPWIRELGVETMRRSS